MKHLIEDLSALAEGEDAAAKIKKGVVKHLAARKKVGAKYVSALGIAKSKAEAWKIADSIGVDREEPDSSWIARDLSDDDVLPIAEAIADAGGYDMVDDFEDAYMAVFAVSKPEPGLLHLANGIAYMGSKAVKGAIKRALPTDHEDILDEVGKGHIEVEYVDDYVEEFGYEVEDGMDLATFMADVLHLLK